jgi:adenine-specific DNA-methyltransferase
VLIKKTNSYGVPERSISNRIIQGDCVSVLNILQNTLKNSVKCIYIDPPYNNGDIYSHYSDKRTHEEWINELEIVLTIFANILTLDGSIWISIDDRNMHYLKVLADKIFGFENFISTIIWQHRTTRENRNIFSNNHEYLLLYAKNKKEFKKIRNKIKSNSDVLARYKNPDNDRRGLWQSVSAHVQDGHAVSSQYYDLIAPNGKIHKLPNGRCWAYNKDKMLQEIKKNNIWFGINGNGVPRIKSFLKEDSKMVTPETLWLAQDVGTTDSAKKHSISLFRDKVVFDTPKPEQLIKRVLEISTREGDLVLDSFLGSGTTTSTAHKMNRSYIGIEKEAETINYVIERLKNVMKGESGGISPQVDWKGGGGFSVYSLINA